MTKSKFNKAIGQVLGIAFGTGGAVFIVRGTLDIFPSMSPLQQILTGSVLVIIGVPLLNKIGLGG